MPRRGPKHAPEISLGVIAPVQAGVASGCTHAHAIGCRVRSEGLVVGPPTSLCGSFCTQMTPSITQQTHVQGVRAMDWGSGPPLRMEQQCNQRSSRTPPPANRMVARGTVTVAWGHVWSCGGCWWGGGSGGVGCDLLLLRCCNSNAPERPVTSAILLATISCTLLHQLVRGHS